MAEVLLFPAPMRAASTSADDAAARAHALNTKISCVVEAPAGSGKTGLLVQRYLKLLSDATVEEPEEVLAITFTNKATSELRDRVLEQLQVAKEGHLSADAPMFEQQTHAFAIAVQQRSTTCGWGLLERPSRLNVRSIDSVCAEIANSLPLLSGNGGRRQPVEDAGPLHRLAARRTLLQLGGSDPVLHEALRVVLLHRDGSLLECEKLLAEMLQAREQWGELIPLTRGAATDVEVAQDVRLKLERSLESVVCAGLSRAQRAMPSKILKELASLAAQMSEHPPFKSDISPISICAERHEPPAAAAEHLEHWRALIGLVLKKDDLWRKRCSRSDVGFELPKAHQTQLEQLIAGMQSDALLDAFCAVRRLPPTRYPDDQWAVVKALFHVLRHALVELRLLFAERGECDFAELALAARAALRADDGASDAALAAGGRLRHLLVDEMQDTSSGQYELLDLLTRSWDGKTQTLFLVGDPKQSIYLFRQARVERFLRTMQEQRLGEIELTPLQLTSNFRSQSALVRDFNRVFELLFPRPDDPSLLNSEGVDVPFVEANAVRTQTGEEGIVWHPTIFSTRETDKDYAAKEAREIRRIVEQRLSMPLPDSRNKALAPKPWRIAILGRARTHLTAVIAEFKRDYGDGPVPFRGIDLDPLDGRAEVLDALAITRALLHPLDRIAWLAVLHAPWCGLCKADLLALTGEGAAADSGASVASLVRDRRVHLSASGRALLDRTWPILETAIAMLGRTTFATHVERTWFSLGGNVALSHEQQSNVRRYFSILRDVESEGRVDVSLLMSRLQRLYAEPLSGAIVQGVLPVELMTIHKAKGLEWDVVLVPGLERGGGRSGNPLLNWLEFDGVSDTEDQPGILLAPISQKGTDSDQLSTWLAGVRRRREEAERKRLLYVATTRAREELHLFGAATMTAKGELSPGHWDSLLKACWPAAAIHFQKSEQAVPMDQLYVERYPDMDGEELSLAAAGEDPGAQRRTADVIRRLPLTFNPAARFQIAAEDRLSYAAASTLRLSAAFDRPEGSFAARAFGNVVHRYMEVMAGRLQGSTAWDDLAAELSSWNPRLIASLRGEGLSPGLAVREAARAQTALQHALYDPVGRWIVSQHASAASERSLTLGSPSARSLRVDRTFLAGDTPLSYGATCIWIIDYKTGEQGSRSDEEFEAAETAKYSAQLEAYAHLRRALPDGQLPIRLGLFYPLVPRLIHWLSLEHAEATKT